MTDIPPTQHLKPQLFDERQTNTILHLLDEIEERGVVLKQHTVSELREKIRRRFRTWRKYGFDPAPYTRDMVTSIIEGRLRGDYEHRLPGGERWQPR